MNAHFAILSEPIQPTSLTHANGKTPENYRRFFGKTLKNWSDMSGGLSMEPAGSLSGGWGSRRQSVTTACSRITIDDRSVSDKSYSVKVTQLPRIPFTPHPLPFRVRNKLRSKDL